MECILLWIVIYVESDWLPFFNLEPKYILKKKLKTNFEMIGNILIVE